MSTIRKVVSIETWGITIILILGSWASLGAFIYGCYMIKDGFKFTSMGWTSGWVAIGCLFCLGSILLFSLTLKSIKLLCYYYLLDRRPYTNKTSPTNVKSPPALYAVQNMDSADKEKLDVVTLPTVSTTDSKISESRIQVTTKIATPNKDTIADLGNLLMDVLREYIGTSKQCQP